MPQSYHIKIQASKALQCRVLRQDQPHLWPGVIDPGVMHPVSANERQVLPASDQ